MHTGRAALPASVLPTPHRHSPHLQGERDQDKATDREKAARDAQMLFDAGEEKRWGSDKSEFNRVFMTSNDEQMICTFDTGRRAPRGTALLPCPPSLWPSSLMP